MKQTVVTLGARFKFMAGTRRQTPKLFVLGLLVMLVQLARLPLAQAGTVTWDASGTNPAAPTDGAGNWSAANVNWSNGSTDGAWTNGDNAIFGAGGAGGIIAVGSGTIVGNITINTNYVFSGNTLTLTNAPTINVAGSATATTVGNPIAGTAFAKEGGGTLILNPAANNTFTGLTTINNGAVQVGGNDGRVYIDGDLLVNPAGTFRFTSGGPGGGVILPSATLIVNGGTVIANVNGKYLPINKLVLDNGGSIIMPVPAPGNCYFDPTNIDARSGYIYANLYRAVQMNLFKSTAGTVIISNRPNTAASDGYIVNLNSGTLIFDKSSQNANRLLPNAVLMLGGGSLVFSNGNSALAPQVENPGTAGTTINPGASSVSGINAGASGGNVTFGAFTRKVGGTFDIAVKTGPGTFSTTTANNNNILGGWATWAGADWLAGTALGAYTAYATGGNPTAWLPADNVSLGAVNVGAFTADTTINSLKYAATPVSDLALGGHTLTLASGGLLVTGSAAPTISGGTLQGGSGADLIVQQFSTGDLAISATLADNIGATSLTKSGPGKLVLTGMNSMTGTNYLNGGIVEVSDLANLAAGPLVMNNGSLRYTGSDASNNRAITVNGLGGTFDVTGGAKFTQDGAITGSGAALGDLGGITKTGSGTLALTASNNFNGGMVVSNGTLLVNGTNNYNTTSFGAGKVTVYGGTLGGTGTIMGPVTVRNGAMISPGAGIGTLTLVTNLALDSGSTCLFEESNSVAGDLLQIQGNLTIQSNSTIAISVLGAALAPVTNTLITYTGTKTGSFNPTVVVTSGSLDSSVTIDESTPGQIKLVAVPRVAITCQFQDIFVSVNEPVTFTACATGTAPLAYQWYFTPDSNTPAAPIDGATGSSYYLAAAQETNSGLYSVVVANDYNSVTSNIAFLSVGKSCLQLYGPFDQTVIQGSNAIFSAIVFFANPYPTFQWQTNGVNVDGATNLSLTLSNVQYSALNNATVSIIASNADCMVTNNATLTVIVPPYICPVPDITVHAGETAVFHSCASGFPPPSLQWLKNGTAITGETNDTLTITNAQGSDIAIYTLVAANSAGSSTSSGKLTVLSTTLVSTAVAPASTATAVCYDTPLSITFNGAVSIVNSGRIRIYNATNSIAPVDTIDLSSNTVVVSTLNGSRGIYLTNNIQAHGLFQGDGTVFNYFPVIITGTTAAIYPHLGVLTSHQTYYVTMDNGIVADSTGAYFSGISDTNAWRFTTKPAGPVNPMNLVVAADGSGDFVTVQGAVDSIPATNYPHTLINIRDGNYVEIVNVSGKTNITFRGQSRSGTVVGYGNNNNLNPGTASRMAFKVNANDIAIENLTLVNRTPQGGSQAETIMVNTGASRFILNYADVNSLQDTILANSTSSQGYFYNTTIRGNFDYLWGGGNLFITNCLIYTVPNIYVTNNYNLTAARTGFSSTNDATYRWPNPAGGYSADGFSFVHCELLADPTVTTITLAGPNGTANGVVAFINCCVDTNHYVTPLGGVLSTYLLWEYSNYDATCSYPVSLGLTVLTNGDPRLLAAETATNWLYGWQPALAPNIIGQPANQSASIGQPASFTVAATGIPDPTYQWYQNGLPVSGATAATYSIGSAVRTNGGSYTVVASNGSGSVTSIVATLTYVNTSPTTSPSTYVRPVGFPLNIVIAGSLATNWADVDGDVLALTSGISSTNGASVAYDSSYVHYTNANDVADEVDYTIGDGFGGTAPGLINIVIGPPPTNTVAGAVVNGNGSVTLNFVGVPGYTYQVDATTSLTPPVVWTTISTNTADIGGLWQITDQQATNYVNQFYRSAYRP